MSWGAHETPAFRVALVAVLVFAAAGASCASETEPGLFGVFRYAGRARGGAPLNLLPPVSDRSGNTYILYGGPTIPDVEVYVGRIGGGWTSGCALTKGDRYGVHGWVGFDEEHHWYWAGDALISVDGRSADCHLVLDRDPGTDVGLLFRGVLPAVRDAPSRTTVVALVQSAVDPAPFSALVDLEAEILTNVRAFEPGSATDVSVVGVGADREENLGFALLHYRSGDASIVEGRFYDAEANPVATARIPSDALAAYAVQGYLQADKSGLVAGLLEGNRLVTFDRRGGRVTDIPRMSAVGVHRWDGELWLVGTTSNRPVVAHIDSGGALGPNELWSTSADAAAYLTDPQEVRDDRSLPSRMTQWSSVSTAMGEFPFLHAHSPIRYTSTSTLWLVAGPSTETGGARVTAFAVAPAGISYP